MSKDLTRKENFDLTLDNPMDIDFDAPEAGGIATVPILRTVYPTKGSEDTPPNSVVLVSSDGNSVLTKPTIVFLARRYMDCVTETTKNGFEYRKAYDAVRRPDGSMHEGKTYNEYTNRADESSTDTAGIAHLACVLHGDTATLASFEVSTKSNKALFKTFQKTPLFGTKTKDGKAYIGNEILWGDLKPCLIKTKRGFDLWDSKVFDAEGWQQVDLSEGQQKQVREAFADASRRGIVAQWLDM